MNARADTLARFAVSDSNGSPVASAQITIDGSKRTLATDARGNARVRLNDGTHRYRITAFGYESANGTFVMPAATAIAVRLQSSAAGLKVIESVTGHARVPFNTAPAAERVYPREAYRDQGQPSVASVMNETPGELSLVSSGSAPGLAMTPQFPSVRNALPFETPVSIEGDPVSLPSSGTFDTTLLPTFVLQEVEIVKGEGDVSGAGSGTGGAINYRLADPTLQRRGTFETEGDSRGGSFTDLAYDGTQPGGKIAVATMLSVDGTPCCGPLPADAVRRAALVKLRTQPFDHVTANATILNVALSRNVASFAGFEEPNGSLVAIAPSLAALGTSAFTFADGSLSLDEGRNAYEAHVYASSVRTTTTDASYAAQSIDRETGASLQWQHSYRGLAYGMLLRDETGSAASDDVYAQPLENGSGDVTTLARAFATLKADKQQFEVALEDAHRRFDAMNARVGYARLLAPGVNVRASYGTSGVLPSIGMLSSYQPYVVSFAGLPPQIVTYRSSIDTPERSTGGDVGVEWRLHGNTTTLSADLYRNSTQATYMAASGMDWINGPPLVESGAELTLTQFKRVGMGFIVAASFPRTYVWGSVPPAFYATGANAAVVPEHNLTGGIPLALGNLNDVAAVRFPYAQGYAEISYKWPRGSRASLGALYVGSNNAFGRPAFATFNSNLELSLGSRGKLQLSAENLFNANVGTLPLLGAGTAIPLANGASVASPLAGLTPFTLRFMIRESFGEGALYEH